MASRIQTRCLVLSDTHGEALHHRKVQESIDVVFHCGDLTEESKLDEFETTIRLLQGIDAPLKLVIPGNHDWSLDDAMFEKKIAEMKPSQEDLKLVEKVYGRVGEAKQLFANARETGVHLLSEGIHRFELTNGAVLTVYASPFTQSVNDWGFQYHPDDDHVWAIDDTVDVAITHSPPKGVLDYISSRERAGSASLFAAIALARPQMHCFGHIHDSWGAKMVAWRDEPGDTISHFTAIDNEQSTTIESLSTLRPTKSDNARDIEEKGSRRDSHDEKGYCAANRTATRGKETLFINAAIEGAEDFQQHWPWLANLSLPAALDRTFSKETRSHEAPEH
ncbi:ser/Thr protein phosphatase family protein [Neohortaea acidophila]|uniref:Ser/Thr protein phosphatase family protein n=1 Tax=Neohortaea acidophila TaxID=245834 RepID=A0A6A6PXD0_9PEZI|nr:ser/Thr protein phosphatase family protein [Neohortaea acidophila]KAF2484411.1 ser/Thr protein phosphatase family protein [Neohortaea acidophila]